MAHMDEVGFLVREVTPEGYIYMQAVGDWIDPVLLAQRWAISTPKGIVFGYSGAESVHAMPDNNPTPIPPQRQLFIDIGAKSKDEALRMGIRPGLPITPLGDFMVIGDGTRYLAKAFDDRALLAIMTELLPRLADEQLSVQLQFAATVQEEVGMRGSTLVFAQTKPDLVINLDVGIARDFPLYFGGGFSEPVLGKGPTLFVFDWGMIPNDKLVNYVAEVAIKSEIPFQFELEDNYEQDGCNLQKSDNGIPCINLGLPVRYPHSQSGIMERTDYDHLTDLLFQLIMDLTPQKIEALHP
jgi:putative aminopeptidase FrvX